MSGARDTHRIEEHFYAQYLHLDEDALREIAQGDVPWVRDGEFAWPARRAARRVLEERGLGRLPHVPAWDPHADRIPTWARGAVVAVVLALFGVAVAAFAWVDTSRAPTPQTACAEVGNLIAGLDVAYHHRVSVVQCEVGPVRGERQPVAVRVCGSMSAAQLERLRSEPQPRITRWLQRFRAAERPGDWCSPEPAVVAEIVTPKRRPWHARLL